jgi:formamidopyrimidine-DNA glycosylase
MPELPEVETIKRDLEKLVLGRRITFVQLKDQKLLKYPDEQHLIHGLVGTKIKSVDRRAKYLLIHLSSGEVLVVQLRITGQLLLTRPDAPITKSTRLIMGLDEGSQLRLVDSSRFAQIHLLPPELLDEFLPLSELGPEIISRELTLTRFKGLLAKHHREIKPLLLDQRVVSGLGSIYADEALFAARIHPKRFSDGLSDEEDQRLYSFSRAIVNQAIEERGSTTRSYRDVTGRKGHYQEKLNVVHRKGEPCRGCEGVVEEDTVAGRGTYYCPRCQV